MDQLHTPSRSGSCVTMLSGSMILERVYPYYEVMVLQVAVYNL